MLESLSSGEHSWRVIGISEDALREIAGAGKRTTQQRGHWYPRKARYVRLFGEEQLNRDVFVRFFFEHDTTVIMIKTQNNKGGDHSTWGKIIPVEEGYFRCRGYIFGVRKRKEVLWPGNGVAGLDTGR